jgi:hypothetical protein
MIIQHYPDELDYVNAHLHPKSGTDENSFLFTFCRACLRADSDNYELIRPALLTFMTKYKANPSRLWMERHDRGIDEPRPSDGSPVTSHGSPIT